MKTKLIIAILLVSWALNAQDKYSDVLLDSYYSGANPAFSTFYGTNGMGSGIEPVNPNVCVGNTPYFVSLPKGSYVTVGFVDNLIFDAPNQNDIFIQEKGSADELADIYVSSDNGTSFTYFGQINGGITNAIDLADIGYTDLVNAVKIVGLDNNGAAPGFDVARIYGIKGANCTANASFDFPTICQDSILDITGVTQGTWSGSIVQDSQLVALDTGAFYLTHIVQDPFPVCPNDTAIIPIHIAPCDCRGIPYGDFVVDDCALCLDPLDSTFNKSCLDCAGVPFGKSRIDACNQCLPPGDINRCTTDNIIYVPNAFSPNGDGLNDIFDISFRQGVDGKIIGYSIFSRWGELMFHSSSPSIRGKDHWWDGRVKGRKVPSGVYIYLIQIELSNGERLAYSGDVTLLR